jgi:ferritin
MNAPEALEYMKQERGRIVIKGIPDVEFEIVGLSTVISTFVADNQAIVLDTKTINEWLVHFRDETDFLKAENSEEGYAA